MRLNYLLVVILFTCCNPRICKKNATINTKSTILYSAKKLILVYTTNEDSYPGAKYGKAFYKKKGKWLIADYDQKSYVLVDEKAESLENGIKTTPSKQLDSIWGELTQQRFKNISEDTTYNNGKYNQNNPISCYNRDAAMYYIEVISRSDSTIKSYYDINHIQSCLPINKDRDTFTSIFNRLIKLTPN